MSVHVAEGRGLERIGFHGSVRCHWNLLEAQLYEAAITAGEATLAADGPLVARTGQHTGRAPNDRFLVDEATSHGDIDWGPVNRPMDEGQFEVLYHDLMAYMADRTRIIGCRFAW